MMEINNKHIVLMLLIIIIGVFIYNYDVYVIPKNEPLCKPVFVTKREMTPEIRAQLNKTESEILKETFGNLQETEYFESFGELTQYDVPPKSFGSFVIPSLTSQHKIKVMDSVIKILTYIPTNYCETQIKQMIEYFGIIYENSSDLESFYKNVASSKKINESPYNSKYSHLILFLIGKFDFDYVSNSISNSVSNSKIPEEQYMINELIKEIINKKSTQELEPTNLKTEDYLSEQNDLITKINTESNSKSNTKSKNKSKNKLKNKINNKINNLSKYADTIDSKFSIFANPMNNFKTNNSNRIYKCDSSYPDAIGNLDKETKPIEGFGNIYDDYASF